MATRNWPRLLRQSGGAPGDGGWTARTSTIFILQSLPGANDTRPRAQCGRAAWRWQADWAGFGSVAGLDVDERRDGGGRADGVGQQAGGVKGLRAVHRGVGPAEARDRVTLAQRQESVA